MSDLQKLLLSAQEQQIENLRALERAKNRAWAQEVVHKVAMMQAVAIMNAPLQETARLIRDLDGKPYGHPQSAVQIREKRENIEGLKGWLAVMTIATLAGFAIAYAAKHWF